MADDVDILICGTCKKSFELANIVKFIEHKKLNCSLRRIAYAMRCGLCPKRFTDLRMLVRHSQGIHRLPIVGAESEIMDDDEEQPAGSDVSLQCTQISASLSMMDNKHEGRAIFEEHERQNDSPTGLDLLVTAAIVEDSMDSSASTPPQNAQHLDMKSEHRAEAPFRPFRHLKKFKCDECAAIFKQKIHLLKHKSKHTGIKPYKCEKCEYSTVEKSHLKVHVRIHTGEKPFKCPFCVYASTQNSTLRVHIKRRHAEVTAN